MKTCLKCGYEKGETEFYTKSRHPDRRVSSCKKCCRQYEKMRGRKKTPEEQRKHWLSSVYGLTLQGYACLLGAQGGKCPICKNIFVKTPHIDHDHLTGKVRGLLCKRCNQGIGMLKDSSVILRSAANYLEQHGK